MDQKKKREKGCGGDQFSWDIQRWLGTKKGGGYWYQPWSPVVGSVEDPNSLVTQDCNTPTATNSPQLSWWEAPKCSLAWTSVTWCLEDTSSFHHWGNQKPSLLQTPRRGRCCCPSPHPKELLLQSPQNQGCHHPPNRAHSPELRTMATLLYLHFRPGHSCHSMCSCDLGSRVTATVGWPMSWILGAAITLQAPILQTLALWLLYGCPFIRHPCHPHCNSPASQPGTKRDPFSQNILHGRKRDGESPAAFATKQPSLLLCIVTTLATEDTYNLTSDKIDLL